MNLSDFIGVRDGGEDRLVVATAHHLDLTAFHQCRNTFQKLWLGFLINLLEDPGKVADRLVIVKQQSKVDTTRLSYSHRPYLIAAWRPRRERLGRKRRHSCFQWNA